MISTANQRRRAFRFSLKTALLLFIPIAVALAALRNVDQLWVSLVTTGTSLLVLASVVATVFGETKQRAFRGGFAVFCGGYFLLYCLSLSPPAFEQTNSIVPRLITTKALYFVHDQLYRDSSLRLYPDGTMSGVGGVGFGAAPGGFQYSGGDAQPIGGSAASPALQPFIIPPQIDSVRAGNFLIIGQCLWAWILGWIGGVFAQFVSRRQLRTGDAQNAASSAASPASAAKTV